MINEESRHAMRELLAEVRDGTFAKRWISENEQGRPAFTKHRLADVDHPLERAGRELRRMMPFVQPKEIVPGAH